MPKTNPFPRKDSSEYKELVAMYIATQPHVPSTWQQVYSTWARKRKSTPTVIKQSIVHTALEPRPKQPIPISPATMIKTQYERPEEQEKLLQQFEAAQAARGKELQEIRKQIPKAPSTALMIRPPQLPYMSTQEQEKLLSKSQKKQALRAKEAGELQAWLREVSQREVSQREASQREASKKTKPEKVHTQLFDISIPTISSSKIITMESIAPEIKELKEKKALYEKELESLIESRDPSIAQRKKLSDKKSQAQRSLWEWEFAKSDITDIIIKKSQEIRKEEIDKIKEDKRKRGLRVTITKNELEKIQLKIDKAAMDIRETAKKTPGTQFYAEYQRLKAEYQKAKDELIKAEVESLAFSAPRDKINQKIKDIDAEITTLKHQIEIAPEQKIIGTFHFDFNYDAIQDENDLKKIYKAFQATASGLPIYVLNKYGQKEKGNLKIVPYSKIPRMPETLPEKIEYIKKHIEQAKSRMVPIEKMDPSDLKEPPYSLSEKPYQFEKYDKPTTPGDYEFNFRNIDNAKQFKQEYRLIKDILNEYGIEIPPKIGQIITEEMYNELANTTDFEGEEAQELKILTRQITPVDPEQRKKLFLKISPPNKDIAEESFKNHIEEEKIIQKMAYLYFAKKFKELKKLRKQLQESGQTLPELEMKANPPSNIIKTLLITPIPTGVGYTIDRISKPLQTKLIAGKVQHALSSLVFCTSSYGTYRILVNNVENINKPILRIGTYLGMFIKILIETGKALNRV